MHLKKRLFMEENKNLNQETQNTEHTHPVNEELNNTSESIQEEGSKLDHLTETLNEKVVEPIVHTTEEVVHEVKETVVHTAEEVAHEVKENVVKPVIDAVEEVVQEIKEEVNNTPPSPVQNQQPQQAYYPPVAPEKNNIGLAGFIISIVGFFVGWIPIFGWLIWLVGLVLSIVGLFKKPKGLAIAGLVISLILFIFLIFGFALLAGAAALS